MGNEGQIKGGNKKTTEVARMLLKAFSVLLNILLLLLATIATDST